MIEFDRIVKKFKRKFMPFFWIDLTKVIIGGFFSCCFELP
jgi:hypothetical protein